MIDLQQDLHEKKPVPDMDLEEPGHQESPGSMSLWPLPGVLSRGGRRKPQLVVDFDLSPTICHAASPSACSATELQPACAPSVRPALECTNEEVPAAPKRRWRPHSLLTPSSCTPQKGKPSFDFGPCERTRNPAAAPDPCKLEFADAPPQKGRPQSIATPSSCKSSKSVHHCPWQHGPALEFHPGEDSVGPLESATPCPAVSQTSPATPPQRSRQRSFNLGLLTPQSCTSNPYRLVLTPRTPEPVRGELKCVMGNVSIVFFDFDGTLTATPGEKVVRQSHKSAELRERAPLLAPRLTALRDAGVLVGIISKSTEFTIRNALEVAGLAELITGPIVGKAVGLEGKVGFIEDLALAGSLSPLLGSEEASLRRILLVDDDVRELDRARARGVQTFPAPAEGGLQEEDLREIFACLGVCATLAPTCQEEHCSPKCSAGYSQVSTSFGVSSNRGI